MKKYLLLAALGFALKLSAQTLRPDVFVVGNNNAAVAAAIQAAESNVKTILLLQAGGFDINPIGDDLHSGIQARFLAKIKAAKGKPDSLVNIAFDKQLANDVLVKWTDSTKNLTVLKNVYWSKADRSGNGWAFKLSDGKTIRPEVLVNAADPKLNLALKIDAPVNAQWTAFDYGNTVYKTNVASGRYVAGNTNSNFSLYQMLVPKQENLVYISDQTSMLQGQAAGAIAAYAGFFNVKTSESKLKEIQGELVAHKASLVPYSDISAEDPNWRAIQFVGLTGLLKGDIKNNLLHLDPERLVQTEDIKQAMKDHFYKAQIWFDDYREDKITVAAAIDLLRYVGNKEPLTTKKLVEKKWQLTYKFEKPFNAEQQISRRQLAVLLQEICPPFNVTIDSNGKIIR